MLIRSHRPLSNAVSETLQPALDCFDRFALQGLEHESVEIYIANMEKLVLFLGKQMPSLADLLAVPLQQGLRLHPIMYHDEAIASNPLSSEKMMKSMLVYLSWKELKRSLFLEDVWLPECCIQHMDLDRLPSGFNGVMSLLVEHLLSPRWQEGFATDLILGFGFILWVNAFEPTDLMDNILPSFYILDGGWRFTPYLYIGIYI